jgi:ABC-type oligopeptide transport system substrate-binding subunit
LLAQAGYEDPATFPAIEVSIAKICDPNSDIERMWRENLGISNISVNNKNSENSAIKNLVWAANYNDPKSAMSDFVFMLGKMDMNGTYAKLVIKAGQVSDPRERQEMYIEAEKILCEDDVLAVPFIYFYRGW